MINGKKENAFGSFLWLLEMSISYLNSGIVDKSQVVILIENRLRDQGTDQFAKKKIVVLFFFPP